MWTLYGSAGSGSAAVEMALARCGQRCRVRRASTWEPDSAQDELQRVNPLGQIPTLVAPDGSVLTESAAILIHLGLSYPDSGLLPTQPAARAQALRALVFIAANCYAAIGVVDYPERWCTGDDKALHERVRSGARARLHHCWSLFADQFSASPFLGGQAPNAVDLLAAVVSRWSGAGTARARRTCTKPSCALEAHPHWRRSGGTGPARAERWPGKPAYGPQRHRQQAGW
jgi:GST-like protein